MSCSASEYLHEPDLLTPDKPTQTLYAAVHKYNDYSSWRPLDNARNSDEESFNEEVLSLFSWANRSVLQLPLAAQTYIAHFDKTISRIEHTLQNYDRLIGVSRAWTGFTPTQLLHEHIRTEQLCGIDFMLDITSDLDHEMLTLLKAANGSEEPISQSDGAATLAQYLSEEPTGVKYGYKSRLAIISRCTDKVDILEQLIAKREGLEILKVVSKYLSKLKTHITDHYTYEDDGHPPTYKYKLNELPEFASDLNAGKLHSVVVSMSADPDLETDAAEILHDACKLQASEKYAYEPKPTQIINRLQYLYSEARETRTGDETAHIMTGLCRFVAECEENSSSLYTVNGRRSMRLTIPYRPTPTGTKEPYERLNE